MLTGKRSPVLFASMPLTASNSNSSPSIHRSSTSLGNSVNLPIPIVRGRRELFPGIVVKILRHCHLSSRTGLRRISL